MKNIKSYKLFERITYSTLKSDNKELIQSIEEDIEMIFLDLLDDDGFNLDFDLTDYAGNISNISISRSINGRYKPIKFNENPEYLDAIEHLYQYIIKSGLKFFHISSNGWLCDTSNRGIQFNTKDWDFIKQKLIESQGERGINKMIFNILDIHKLNTKDPFYLKYSKRK